MLKVLRQRNFRLLVIGQGTSLLGDWMMLVALPLYVFRLTGSTGQTGLAFVFGVLPALVIAPLGGVLADRVDRRALVITMDILRGAVLLLLLGARSADFVWVIYMVTFLESCFSQLSQPAQITMIPVLVKPEEVTSANQTDAFVTSLVRIIGPPVAGTLIAVLSIGFIAVLDAVTYAVSAVTMLMIKMPPRASRDTPMADADAAAGAGGRPNALNDLVEGFRFLRSNRTIAGLIGVFGLVMVAQGAINVLFVPFVRVVLEASSRAYGTLMGFQGAGSLAGAILVGAVIQLLKPTRLISAGLVAGAIGFFVMVNLHVLPVIAVMSFVLGAIVIAVLVTTQSLIQLIVPDEFRGRVIGVFTTCLTVGQLLGLAGAAALGDRLSTVHGLDLAAAILLLAGVLALLLPKEAGVLPKAADLGEGAEASRDEVAPAVAHPPEPVSNGARPNGAVAVSGSGSTQPQPMRKQMPFDAVTVLDAAGVPTEQLNPGQWDVVSSLTVDEVELIISLKDRLEAVEEDLQPHLLERLRSLSGGALF